MTRCEWLALIPRDTVLIRDGRQFEAGTDASAEPVLPGPSSVSGAAFAAYGGTGPEPDALRGPVLAVKSGRTWQTIFPVPADVVYADTGGQWIRRLRPQELPVATDLSGECSQWLVGDGDAASGWWSSDTLAAYLRGELLGDPDQLDLPVGEIHFEFGPGAEHQLPLAPERRVGLARTADRVARDRFLYQSSHLRAVDGVTLLTECVLPASWNRKPSGPVNLGGRGRLADVEVATGVGWPEPPNRFPGGRVLVYVATPAIWPDGWRIPVPEGARLVAAAVGAAEPVATASPRLGMEATRVLRWAVPNGSVYLLSFDGGDEAAAGWAISVHATAYGREPWDRLRTAGYGVVLTGVGS